jgi:hypothetical protein
MHAVRPVVGIPTTSVYPQSTSRRPRLPLNAHSLAIASFACSRVVHTRRACCPSASSHEQCVHRPRAFRVPLHVSKPLHVESLVLINYAFKTTTIRISIDRDQVMTLFAPLINTHQYNYVGLNISVHIRLCKREKPTIVVLAILVHFLHGRKCELYIVCILMYLFSCMVYCFLL